MIYIILKYLSIFFTYFKKIIDIFDNFFKKDILSEIFIQAGISELKSIFYSVSILFSDLIKKNNQITKISIITYSKIAIYRDSIQTNIMGFTSLVGAFASQFNYENK